MRSRHTFLRAAQIAALCGMAGTARAQVNAQTPGWFVFTIPGLEASATPIDLSGLNSSPAGASGFIQSQGGHLTDGGGRRLRFFGMNLTAYSNFPDKATAPLVAARLAKMGVNLIRLHFLDEDFDGMTLWQFPLNGQFNPAQVDKLDYFVSQLKSHGVYVDMNLHVAYDYQLPNGLSGDFDFGKGLDNYFPLLIQQQKNYAQMLLTHVNPYTGNAYVNEPAVAWIETNNENSLAGTDPQALLALPAPFITELANQWQIWLKNRYATTAALANAWKPIGDSGQTGELCGNPNFASNGAGWFLQLLNGGAATLTNTGGNTGGHFNITALGNAGWNVQIVSAPFSFYANNSYQISLTAKADANRTINVYPLLNSNPYTGFGTIGTPALTPAYQTFIYTVAPQQTAINNVVLHIDSALQTGAVDIQSVSVKHVAQVGLPAGQSLEAGNIALPVATSDSAVYADFKQFLIDTDLSYAQTMHNYIKNTLGAHQLISQTQSSYAEAAGIRREQTVSDFADNHTYWQHPAFPGRPFDINNWSIGNTSQFTDPNGGAFLAAAKYRIAGKAFTMSEANIPAPNDHAPETLPTLAAYACLQDWDAIIPYTYADFVTDYGRDSISGWFSLLGDPGQLAFAPFAAYTFRNGLIQPAKNNYTLTVSDAQMLGSTLTNYSGGLVSLWRQAVGYDFLPLISRVSAQSAAGSAALTVFPAPPAAPTNPIVSDTGQLIWDSANIRMAANAPAARLYMGNIGGTTGTLGDVQISAAASGPAYAHIAVVALDGLPIAISQKVLITALGRSENQNMGWNAARTTVENQWGTGPAVTQGVVGYVQMPSPYWRAQSLDGTGAVKQSLAMSGSRLNFSAANGAVWYLLTPNTGVFGTVTLEGLVPSAPSQTLTFQFRDPNTHLPLFTRTATITQSGSYAITGIGAGNYELWIKGPKNLAQVVAVNTSGGSVFNVNVTLPAGDANNDNFCDTSDFGVLVGAYGGSSSAPGSGYDATADFNGDGFVDTTDFGLLVGNYGSAGAN